MRDQAFQLRNLAIQAARRRLAEEGSPPQLLVMAGGKGGVGVTTLALNLSVAMGVSGARVVLVDADLYRADIATLCGLRDERTVRDVLEGRCDIHEVLQRGPGGILVVPGLWAPEGVVEYTDAAQQRLIRQFHTLGRHADIVVIDVGGGAGKVVRQFAQAANDVVMVTTPDSVSIMDTYATIKTLHGGQTAARLHLLVNQAADDEMARDVHHRLDRSCHRFLALHVDFLGWIPAEPTALETTKSGGPAILRDPDTPLSSSITKLAWQLTPQRDAQSGGRAAA